MEIKRAAKEQEIWNKEEEVAQLQEKAKKLVLEQFYKQIKIFGKKVSERMLMRKIQNYVIVLKEKFVPRKGKIYFLSRKEKEEVREYIQKQIKIYLTIKVITNCTSILGKKD